MGREGEKRENGEGKGVVPHLKQQSG